MSLEYPFQGSLSFHLHPTPLLVHVSSTAWQIPRAIPKKASENIGHSESVRVGWASQGCVGRSDLLHLVFDALSVHRDEGIRMHWAILASVAAGLLDVVLDALLLIDKKDTDPLGHFGTIQALMEPPRTWIRHRFNLFCKTYAASQNTTRLSQKKH